MSLALLACAAIVAACGRSGGPDDTVTVHSALNTNVVVTVRDAGGAVMPGKAVTALRSNGTTAGTANTNASGQATFSLADSSYRFRVTDLDVTFYSGAVGHCVTPACTSATISIPHVDVTLVDTSGAPLVNHVVTAMTASSEISWISTDATGHARFALPVDSYRFGDDANGYTFFSGAAGHCTVPSCTTATIVETIPVAVTVRDVTGAPKSGVEVMWTEAQGAMGGWMITDANGVAMLSPAPGSITFTVQATPTSPPFSSTSACVVPGCTSASITIGAPVTVTVQDTAGTALSGSSVQWETNDGFVGGGTNTNASGQATLTPPLQPVMFRVTVDGATFFSGATGHCVQPACTTAAISVSQPTVVTVVDGSGAPISGRAVTPLSTEGITSGNKTTNASGQATFRLPFAHWRFRATCTANSEQFYSGDAGHCVLPGGCLTATIKMPCGQCAGKANGTTCDDQNLCSAASTCQNQRCTAGPAMSCPGDACHDAGACNAQTGACVLPAKANGTICNDGDPCREFDVCQAGVCQGSKPHVCKYVGQCRDPGTCNSAATISTAPPATSDLVAWWHMDGNGDDATGGGHNLTIEGNVVTSPGRFGKAMTFDGTSCMTTPSWAAADLAGASGVTMMAWVNHGTGFTCPWPGPAYPDSQKGQMVGAIMGKGFDYSMGAWCGGQPGDGTQPGITLGSRPAGWQTWGYGGPAGVVPGPDDWALVTVVWDRSSGTAQYVNGQGVGGWAFQADIGNLFSTFGVGCFVDDAAHGNQRIKNYIGTIDEVLVYKRALSYQEIRDYYFAADPCSRSNKPAGTTCFDNNACTQTDACNGAGECAGSNPVVCAASDQCHQAGSCNPATGYCSDGPRLPDGTTCEEGNRCSVGDLCHAGTCTPGPATGCSAAGAAHYASVIDLGGTRGYTFAQGINSHGDVVGTDTLPTLALYEGPQSGSRAFRWSDSEGRVYLPEVPGQTTSYAKGINDAGVIAGSMSISGNGLFPYRYDPNTTPLPQVVSSGGFGRRINAAGTMTGGNYFSSGLRMFRIGTGAIEELPAILNPDPVAMQTWGEDISVDGTVVGTHVTTGGGREPVRYSANRGTESLNSLLPTGSGWSLVEAFGINQQTIVGWGLHDGRGRAFRMTVTPAGIFDGIVDLGIPAGFLPEWQNVVVAHRSNASREVVGAVYDQWPYWPQAAFVHTDATGIVLLNSLIDPQSGWNLLAGFDINDSHQVVGYGYHNGQVRPFRMTLPDLSPCPPPTNVCQQQQGTRDPLTGVCSYPAKPDNTACHDDNACTQSETCQAGSCLPPANVPTILNRVVTQVGPLGGLSSSASDISATGQIVGTNQTSDGISHGFLQNGTATPLQIGPISGFMSAAATAVNRYGEVVGTLGSSSGNRGYRYDATNGIRDFLLGDNSVAEDIPGVSSLQGTSAFDINASGQIGGSYTIGGAIAGYRYADGSSEDVGSLEGGRTTIGAINDAGAVFGSSWVQGTPTGSYGPERLGHAVMFDNAVVGLQDLNNRYSLPGWTLYSVTDAAGDYIVGNGSLNGKATAYRLRLSNGAILDLSGGWLGSTYASGVNAAGDVVGWGAPDAANALQAAYVYTQDLGFKNLNDIIVPGVGWDMRIASGINDAQEIVGWGYLGGSATAFRVQIPTPQVAACEARGSTCGPGGDTDTICLLNDGLVDMPDGTFVALFGYANAGASTTPTDNAVLVGFPATQVTNFSPAPPRVFPPGIHEGAFLPRLHGGERVTWRVNGETVTAFGATESQDPNVRHLRPVPFGTSGLGVYIQGELISLKADTGAYAESPCDPTNLADNRCSHTLQPEPDVGPTFNGVLTGTLSVTPAGAAIYTVPIAMPPGIAGMAPNLNLVYNSQGGDGLAGQGWDLTGLSMIHHCPKTMIQDGQTTPVDLDWEDGFCLDGQRLFDVTSSGAYTPVYALEQKDFSRITRDYFDATAGNVPPPPNASFTVVTASGQTRHYGTRDDSRVLFGPEQVAAVWALDRVEDEWGNYYDIHYNSDHDTGLYVTSIDYTKHLPAFGAQPGAEDDRKFNSITFSYSGPVPRPDVRQTRFGVYSLPLTRRLTSINTGLGVYELTYHHDYDPAQPYSSPDNDPMLPSRLDSISYCAGSDCLAPLEFEWDGGGYRWEVAARNDARLFSNINGHYDGDEYRYAGTQFVDLDGDGRLDFIESKGSSLADTVWQNAGDRWIERRNWRIPWSMPLFESSGKPGGTLLADVTGDGLVDLVSDYTPSEICVHFGNTQACEQGPFDLSVWINGIKANPDCAPAECWQGAPQFARIPNKSAEGANGLPSNPVNFKATTGTRSTVADLNGDGKADLIMFAHQYGLYSRLSTGNGWTYDSSVYYGDPPLGGYYPVDRVRMVDFNGDGLADVAIKSRSNTPCAGATIGLNTGKSPVSSLNPTAFKATTFTGCDDDDELEPGQFAQGDVDGDGLLDILAYFRTKTWPHTPPQAPDPESLPPPDPQAGWIYAPAGPRLNLASSGGYTTNNTAALLSTIESLRPHGNEISYPPDVLPDFSFTMADLNADGLADFIQRRGNAGHGRLFVNTGRRFKDLYGETNWSTSAGPADTATVIRQIPVVPTDLRQFTEVGAQFIDLNGDGVLDLVQASAHDSILESHAWLNKFRPPIITKFPKGIAKKTEVDYAVITTKEAQAPGGVYSDPGGLDQGTTYLMAPLRVVSAVRADDGLGAATMATTKYRYESLRGSATGRGPQGFRKVIVTDPTGMSTETTYLQVYPYTGLPKSVVRKKALPDLPGQSVTVTETITKYCNTIAEVSGTLQCTPNDGVGSGTTFPAKTPQFVYPYWIEDKSHLRTGDPAQDLMIGEVTTTTSEFRHDALGAPTRTTVTMAGASGETVTKETINTYNSGFDAPTHKVTRTVTTARRTAPSSSLNATIADGTVTHTTEFDYTYLQTSSAPGVLALRRKRVEPNGGPSIEVHTVYEYDRFGNVTSTTECGDNFNHCNVLEAGAYRFRSSQVSFDPADFNAPAGEGLLSSISYGNGRFPVRMTNALGHQEYAAYDPLLGVVVQQTGPNGVHSRFEYNRLGRQLAVTARAGTDRAARSIMEQHLPSTLPLTAVNITRPPTGATTWVYSDVLGRKVRTLERAFDGGFIETTATYDAIGRLDTETKPHEIGNGQIYTKKMHYDYLDRVSQVDQQLGGIDGTQAQVDDQVIVTHLSGSTIRTTHVVGGDAQIKTEAKNVLGKLAAVTDSAAAGFPGTTTIRYRYDADGNLLVAGDTAPTPAIPTVQYHYDTRGRKDWSRDPDMGYWQYRYNAYGDLTTEIPPGDHDVTMTYDQLGRMTTKTASGQTATWIYDAAPFGIGRLAAMVSPSDDRLNGPCTAVPYNAPANGKRAATWFTYNPFGDVENELQCIDGETFTTSYEYDALERQRRIHYPRIGADAPMVISKNYSALGFLQYVGDGSAQDASGHDQVLWAATAMDALGHVTREYARNGVETISSHNLSTGWLMGRSAFAHADRDTRIQGLSFGYDTAGNLRTRHRGDDVAPEPTHETFGYDPLNRLTSSLVTVGGDSISERYDYDPLGNLYKDGKSYSYYGCGAGPHAVCSVGTTSFGYDAKGNMIASGNREIDYDDFHNKATQMRTPSSAIDFVYDARGNRVVQAISQGGTSTARTVYVGLGATGKSLYERTIKSTGVEHVQFIYADGAHGGNAFAIRVANGASGSDGSTRYYHYDHIGSVTAMSDEAGHVVDGAWGGADATAFGYDAWGARRNPDGHPADLASFNLQPGHREFTGHETIPGIGLINMNGRVYDPTIGRFLSPDPNVQFVANLQSYNRYSYVLNNPLSYNDPTGYFLGLSGEGWFDVAWGLTALMACAGSGGAGCVVVGAVAAIRTTATMYANGASFGQIVAVNAIGIFASAGGGSLGDLTKRVWLKMAAGAVASAVGAVLTNAVMRRGLGENVLTATCTGAIGAALAAWIKDTPLAQANRDAMAKLGASGATRAERRGLSEGELSDRDEALRRVIIRGQAIEEGQWDVGVVGKLTVTVYGQSAAFRQQVLSNLDTMLNGDSADGQAARLALECDPSVTAYDGIEVVLANAPSAQSSTDVLQNSITFDLADIGTLYESESGLQPNSAFRVLTHEVGHLVGFDDANEFVSEARYGIKMDNVVLFENPVVSQSARAGTPVHDRTSYW